MAHQLFHLPRPTAISNNLTLVSGAKVGFFLTGTSTPTNSYQDSALTTPHTNPVVADAAGRLPVIYLDPSILYRITFTDSADVEIYPAIDPANDQLLTQALFNAYLALSGPYKRTDAEIAAGVTPTNYAYEPGDVRRYGYLADGVDGTDIGTDNATAIANALASNAVVDLPEGVALFGGSITLPTGKMLRGKGPRKTTLRQISSANAPAVILGDVLSADITDGAHSIRDLCIKAADNAGSHGIRIGDGSATINASMLDFSNLRLWSQHEETLTSPPYTTRTNQRGIYIQAAVGAAVYMANLRNVEIRSFDIGIDSSGSPVSANEWSFTACWILGSRVAVRLSNCSTWNLTGVTVESGVSLARALQTFNACSNIIWSGGRWEITEPNGWGIEGDGSTAGSNWRFEGINVLIAGDGSGIPGRKWTGTLPNDFLFSGTDSVGAFEVFPNAGQTKRIPQRVVLGGQNLGDGRITIVRDLAGAECVIETAAAGHLLITGGNSVKLRGGGAATDLLEVDGTRAIVHGADGATGFERALRLGANSFLWVDSTGDLRIKQGAPASDLDGVVVGSQS